MSCETQKLVHLLFKLLLQINVKYTFRNMHNSSMASMQLLSEQPDLNLCVVVVFLVITSHFYVHIVVCTLQTNYK